MDPENSIQTDPKKEDTPDYDSPWKQTIQHFFHEFIEFFFPDIDTHIDWKKGYEFMDKELQQLFPDAVFGKTYADIVIKVFQKTGEEAWILIHVEVESKWSRKFTRRMYFYNHRLVEKHGIMVVSLAVVCDKSPKKAPDPPPNSYQRQLWGCNLNFTFPMVRLMDLENDWKKLENDPSPFAIVAMAQIKAKRVKDGDERKRWKFYLTKMLYERGYERQTIVQLFLCIDWMIQLSKTMAKEFTTEHNAFEMERKMAYVTQGEQIKYEDGMLVGLQKGKIEGKIEGTSTTLISQLEVKFGTLDNKYLSQIQNADVETLQKWTIQVLTAPSIDAVFQ